MAGFALNVAVVVFWLSVRAGRQKLKLYERGIVDHFVDIAQGRHDVGWFFTTGRGCVGATVAELVI